MNVRRLGLACGVLDFHQSCLPWKQDTIALRFSASSTEVELLLKRLVSSNRKIVMNVAFQKKNFNSSDDSLVWACCTGVSDSSKRDVWHPMSPRLSNMLKKYHPNIYLIDKPFAGSHASSRSDFEYFGWLWYVHVLQECFQVVYTSFQRHVLWKWYEIWVIFYLRYSDRFRFVTMCA